ncbi:unnamed protein product [Symbiodinium natans]|uniref:Uncharacterized protein n=1 Tax=Symbiodinium natans TaxID=878477 RepID=A0A812UIP1_9DINO|nr:unnamed protein product [Symbiodinium natans]
MVIDQLDKLMGVKAEVSENDMRAIVRAVRKQSKKMAKDVCGKVLDALQGLPFSPIVEKMHAVRRQEMWQVFEEVMARLGVAGGREMETLFNVMDQAVRCTSSSLAAFAQVKKTGGRIGIRVWHHDADALQDARTEGCLSLRKFSRDGFDITNHNMSPDELRLVYRLVNQVVAHFTGCRVTLARSWNLRDCLCGWFDGKPKVSQFVGRKRKFEVDLTGPKKVCQICRTDSTTTEWARRKGSRKDQRSRPEGSRCLSCHKMVEVLVEQRFFGKDIASEKLVWSSKKLRTHAARHRTAWLAHSDAERFRQHLQTERFPNAKKDIDIVVYKGYKYVKVPATTLFPPAGCLRQQQVSEEIFGQQRCAGGEAAADLFRNCYNSDSDLMEPLRE